MQQQALIKICALKKALKLRENKKMRQQIIIQSYCKKQVYKSNKFKLKQEQIPY